MFHSQNKFDKTFFIKALSYKLRGTSFEVLFFKYLKILSILGACRIPRNVIEDVNFHEYQL